MSLPVWAAAPKPRKAGTAGRVPHRRILVVDDNRDAADMLGELLGRLGATVKTAHDGRTALELMDTFQPDAVLLDIGMPEMDGYDVARAIRKMSRHRNVLLIAVTGWGQEHDQATARAAGFDHHIVKPPQIDVLRELLGRGWPTSV